VHVQRYRAAGSASCRRVDRRLDVHHRRPLDPFWSVDFNVPLRHDAGTVQAHRVRPLGRQSAEHTRQRLAHVALGVRGQLVAGPQHGIAVSGHGRIPASMPEKAHDKRR
jgi:hypothetical protein